MSFKETMIKNRTWIMVGMGITGLIGSGVRAVTVTPKALLHLEEEKDILQTEELKPLDYVRACWKDYLPPITLALASTTLIISAQHINMKESALLAGACAATEQAFRAYADKTLEVVGEEKVEEIKHAITKDRMERVLPPQTDILAQIDNGDVLCFEGFSGRYFYSTREKIRGAENNLIQLLRDNQIISLNDYYFEIGLDDTSMGNEMGWSYQDGFKIRVDGDVSKNGQPCLYIEPAMFPDTNYETNYRSY